MASPDVTSRLGDLELRSPLIAASGTVGSVWEWAETCDVSHYGAAVAKSVSPEPWEGRPAPRVAPTRTGMLNGIGIQNPGISDWVDEMKPRIGSLGVPVWGSAVAHDVSGFGVVAKELEAAGVTAVEANLSCPNLDDGSMFSFDPDLVSAVVSNVKSAVDVPVGAKLSPNTPDIVAAATAAAEAGADFVVLTNTAFGLAVDVEKRSPVLSGGVGGYSGPGLKPISLRCVYEVSRAFPNLAIVGCGGISTGRDIVEYVLAGASAVEAGTVHLAEPRAGKRLLGDLSKELSALGVRSLGDLIGAAVDR
ncbi:MAG TPA: dihydroorotate dehydrogenase [Acidimicrobiia bacterium]|nr:dihydroorotate dehydrogenase [Acidimicrobiia bacterium]